MPTDKLPPRDALRNLFDCDPEKGLLYWKRRTPDLFAHCKNPQSSCARWNTVFAGKEALTADHGNGYRRGSLFNRDVFAHRVIWKWVTGEEPEQIDHVNGERSDNRLCNLRNVGYAENHRNKRLRSDSKSGHFGVRWEVRKGRKSRWFTYIREGGKMKFLGYFDRKEDAVACRKAAERRLGFHANHGR